MDSWLQTMEKELVITRSQNEFHLPEAYLTVCWKFKHMKK